MNVIATNETGLPTSETEDKYAHMIGTWGGPVPFYRLTLGGDGEMWSIGIEEYDGARNERGAGRVELRVVEVVPTVSGAPIAIYYRTFFDPDGGIVNTKRRRLGSVAAVKGYITRRHLKPERPAPELVQ